MVSIEKKKKGKKRKGKFSSRFSRRFVESSKGREREGEEKSEEFLVFVLRSFLDSRLPTTGKEARLNWDL